MTHAFEWVLPEADRDARVEAIEVSGGFVIDGRAVFAPEGDEARDYPSANFEPLMMITASASIVFVVQAIAKTWRERQVAGGTVVDARKGRVRIRPVPAMPPGRLVVVDDKGTHVFDKDDETAGKALLSELLAKVGGGAD